MWAKKNLIVDMLEALKLETKIGLQNNLKLNLVKKNQK